MYYPRLRDMREDADKTQKEIAALLGIDQRVYSTYETGKREDPQPVSHCAGGLLSYVSRLSAGPGIKRAAA